MDNHKPGTYTILPGSYLADTHLKVVALDAKINTVLGNQAKILAALTGKSVQDVEEETAKLLAGNMGIAEKEYYNWIAKNTL